MIMVPLEVHDLRKSYGDVLALDGLSLQVAAGEILCILGPNGAGKSTFASIVAGVRRADSGRAVVCGADVAREPERAKANVGYAPQEVGVYPTLTVRDNLGFFAELAGLRGAAKQDAVHEAAEALLVTDLFDRRVRDLSGGQKRRLHTAMALLGHPPVLLLDEPTAGVDPQTRMALLDAVRALAAQGTAICYSTHYLPEAEELDGSIAIIDHGRLIAHGSLTHLMASHARSAIRIVFDGPVPQLDLPFPVFTEGNALVATPPATGDGHLGAVHRALAGSIEQVVSFSVQRPDLETVFLGLTGQEHASLLADAGDGDV
jgi:ABC-2 type transport system ATP-binding protein